MEEIYFYLLPEDMDVVQTLDGLKGYDYRWPSLNWVYGTYYRLKQHGFNNIKLVSEFPAKGIVVAASHQVKLFQKFGKDLFVISTVADTPPRFYTHINVAQNPFQLNEYPHLFRFPYWTHISHWPQPHIIPRNPERGDAFETVGYFGDASGLPADLLSDGFAESLHRLGLRLQTTENNFTDYSNVDVVLGTRTFGIERHVHKPYSKLLNAWLGRVPAIMGMESSFQAIKKSELDFIGVRNKEELLQGLQKLAASPLLRRQMVENGIERSKEFSEEKIVEAWAKLLFEEAPKQYKQWLRKTALERELFFADQFLSRSFRSLKKRLQKAE